VQHHNQPVHLQFVFLPEASIPERPKIGAAIEQTFKILPEIDLKSTVVAHSLNVIEQIELNAEQIAQRLPQTDQLVTGHLQHLKNRESVEEEDTGGGVNDE
jgi:hypothetical protein